MKSFYSILILFLGFILNAQVGIGTDNPTEDLDVNGNIKILNNGKLYLENPGLYNNTTSTSLMLVRDTSDNTLKKFNPATLPFSSVSFTTYFFDNVDESGLSNYDTKIDASKFHLCIGGFRILRYDENTSISLTGTEDENGTINYFPLYNARAFVQDGTWRLTFVPNSGRTFASNIDLYLNVTIYYKNFLTKTNETIVLDINGNISGNGTTPAPDGALP